MCGIAGVLYFDPDRKVEPSLLDRMTDVLAHRGPDGRGVYIDGALGLGHRRLAIIDLSEEAAQPMPNEDESVWVVLNGEIYNFQELREELEAKGHRFRSRSDTEVIVHLYEELGDELVHRLRGMFAFALWDGRRRRLLLARDRFGQKPLYYRLTESSLHFASEIKGIHEDREVLREPDPQAIDAFLTHCYVPSPLTGFRDVLKLPPGHTLTVEADGRALTHRYWSLAMWPKRTLPRRPSRLVLRGLQEELLALIDEATRLRLVSDVPVGAFLSGGVDSSAVVAAMHAGSAERARTFAIGFEEQAYDETPFARAVAEHLGTDHEELILGPTSFDDLDRIAWHYGEPYADASALPTFAVSKMARERVTVALTGDGGDELWCGYPRYQDVRLEERLRSSGPLSPLAHSRALAALLSRGGKHGLANSLMRGRASRGHSLEELYLGSLRYVWPALKTELYTAEFAATNRESIEADAVRRAIAASDGETFAERCAHADALTYLPDDILVKVDVASMAHGLECRAPFLDHVLAEFVAALPFSMKMHRLRPKRLLKQALRTRLPKSVLERAKQGFGVPLEHWFRGELRERLSEVLLSKRALERGYFRASVVERLVREHATNAADHRNVLFPLLMLETWHRVCVDASEPPR